MKLIKIDEFDVSKDPVRPELSLDFRKDLGREIYAVSYSDVIGAIVCIAYCSDVPKNVDELKQLTNPNGHICVAYTIYNTGKIKGSGRDLINLLHKKMKESLEVTRLVTFSPKTEMAKQFHIKNGAFLLRENEDSYNFEYEI